MLEHTPGPWELIEPLLVGTRAVTDDDDDPILIVDLERGGYDYQWRVGELAANARLIAAAPEMLVALYEIAGGSLDPVAVDIAQTLVLKIVGRTVTELRVAIPTGNDT